jgi:hypothetical protein
MFLLVLLTYLLPIFWRERRGRGGRAQLVGGIQTARINKMMERKVNFKRESTISGLSSLRDLSLFHGIFLSSPYG